jgi:hypothetical protein
VNTFKHKVKDAFFNELQKKEDSPYMFYYFTNSNINEFKLI